MKLRWILGLGVLMSLLLAVPALADDDLATTAYNAFEDGIRNMFADRLYEIMCDGDPSTNAMIIDVRAPEDFERGHITGAVRYDLTELFQPDTLATLPHDQRIVVCCYTGQSSSWAVGVLRMMGYDAYNLFYGMSGWTTNPEIYVRRFDASTVPNYPTTKEPAYATETYPMPEPMAGTLAEAATKLFAEGIEQYNLTATQVHEWMTDDDPSNDPFIVSIRQAVSYERGHIEGAIHIEPEELFTPEESGEAAARPAHRDLPLHGPGLGQSHGRPAHPGLRCLQQCNSAWGDGPRIRKSTCSASSRPTYKTIAPREPLPRHANPVCRARCPRLAVQSGRQASSCSAGWDW